VAKPAWRVAGTSVTGAYHALKDEPCQDRHRLTVTPGGILIAVVSDGAGSARFGGEGAAMLCEQVSASLARLFGRGKAKPSRTLVRKARRAVREGIEAARAQALDEVPPDAGLYDYHATLVGAVALPGMGAMFFHIGDGAAVALASASKRWILSPPHNGEYSYETYFFTEPNWQANLRFTLVGPEYDMFFVMTDGVTDLGLKTIAGEPQPFVPFFEPIGRFLAGVARDEGETALAGTLDTPSARERSNDDKTLVWAQAAGR
jgi:hypothetical protein